MTVWCSGKGGLCVAGGLGFESRRPHSPEIYAKKDGDGWTLTGGGLHQLKKIYIFLGKNSHFFRVFFSVPTLPSVRPLPRSLCRVSDKKHSTKTSLPSHFLPSVIRRVLHSANNSPSVLCLLPSVWDTRQTQGVR